MRDKLLNLLKRLGSAALGPVRLWRQGRIRLRRARTDGRGYIKVMFDLTGSEASLPETLAEPPQRLCEWMWAEPVGPGLARLCNSPFYAYGVSFGDTVAFGSERGEFVASRIAVRGGHSTYRLQRAEGLIEEVWSEEWADLQALGCSCEGDGERLVAIDVPPAADAEAVYRLLEEGENIGLWTFEEAHLGHPAAAPPVAARPHHRHQR
ncbi:MAG TPA: DUF4265 domain-containing protein [Caulobacteraceae bacterium]|nr:DUF4265 domain-containing protein [Caulobacteraceae bacterium]